MVRLAALLAALTLALAACSDDDPEPAPPPPPSPSAGTSSSASPSRTTTPEPSQKLGPEETMRAWVAARNKAVQSGDTTEVDALSAPTCETCRNSVDPVAEVYANGGHYETYGWRVAKSRVVKQSDRVAEVSAGLVYDAGRTYPSAGSAPISYEKERHIAIFHLRQNGSGWVVQFIGYLS